MCAAFKTLLCLCFHPPCLWESARQPVGQPPTRIPEKTATNRNCRRVCWGASRPAPPNVVRAERKLQQRCEGCYKSRYHGIKSRYPRSKSRYPGVKSSYPGPKSHYPGLKSSYLGVKSCYPGLKSRYLGFKSHYPGPKSGYPGFKSRYPGVKSRGSVI